MTGGRNRKRQKAYVLGLRAETVAVWLLRLKGYGILARRYSAPGGEIDIIAMRGGVVAFVEVKARVTIEAATLSISQHQRQRISRAARHWLAGHGHLAEKTLRGDAIFLAPWHRPRHVAGAIELQIF